MDEYSPFDVSLTARAQRFHRHALICIRLSHANIVPLLGVFSSTKFPYACIFESVGKDNLPKYLVSNPCTPRLKLVSNLVSFCGRLPVLILMYGDQLVEIARGLHHIHDLDIIHGSIRGVPMFDSQ